MERFKTDSIEILDAVYEKIKDAIEKGCIANFSINLDTISYTGADRIAIGFAETELTGKFSVTINCY